MVVSSLPTLTVEPKTITFEESFAKCSQTHFIVKNTSTFPVLFKVKTTQSGIYRVQPATGVLEPSHAVKVRVKLHSAITDAAKTNKHKFMVQVIQKPIGVASTTGDSIDKLWKTVPIEEIAAQKIPVIFQSMSTNDLARYFHRDSPAFAQQYFLIGMSLTYLFAFASLYYQVPGLYGTHGLLPVRLELNCDAHSILECMFRGRQPTLLHLHSYVGLSPARCMELLCLIGIVVSSLQIMFAACRDCILYFFQWTIYLSLFQVGQTFLWFQWDTLLLESGFLTLFVAPFVLFRRLTGQQRWLPHDYVSIWLVRWLLFRLMFASGVVKLSSECPTWWKLTALHWHWESQCIPTALAWYMHQLPAWFKQLSVVSTYSIEIFIPILFFAPVRHLRRMAFVSQVVFMLLIALTGNYNFFNFITAVLCFSLLVDSSSSQVGSHVLMKYVGTQWYRMAKAAMIGAGYGVVLYFTISLFTLRIDGLTVTSKPAFDTDDLNRALAYYVPILMMLGTLAFFAEVGVAFARCFTDFNNMSARIWAYAQTFVVCGAAGAAFAISLVPLASLDAGATDMVWPDIRSWHEATSSYSLTHSYGLFRRMTGVGGRPEVIIETADTPDGPWREYEFLYKPGALDRAPPFLAPHQPRLDWQMWFAALGAYQHNPWFISLVYRLVNNQSEVIHLINQNSLPARQPKFIRASLYTYHFTSAYRDDAHFSQSDWWWREYKSEYFPALRSDNPSLLDYVKRAGLLTEVDKEERAVNFSWLLGVLGLIRSCAETLQPHVFVWAVTLAAIVGKLALKLAF